MKTRFVIVELHEDSEQDAQTVARRIVDSDPRDVQAAYPAFDDGYGRYVQNGEVVESGDSPLA